MGRDVMRRFLFQRQLRALPSKKEMFFTSQSDSTGKQRKRRMLGKRRRDKSRNDLGCWIYMYENEIDFLWRVAV